MLSLRGALRIPPQGRLQQRNDEKYAAGDRGAEVDSLPNVHVKVQGRYSSNSLHPRP